jgi:hypothetical protein
VDAAEILEGAATLIETEGWAQRMWWDSEKGTCIFLAITRVGWREGIPAGQHAVNAVMDELGLHDPGAVIRWNDAPGTAAEDVLRVLRAAAERARTSRPSVSATV